MTENSYLNWKYKDNYIDLSRYSKTRMYVKRRMKLPEWWFK